MGSNETPTTDTSNRKAEIRRLTFVSSSPKESHICGHCKHILTPPVKQTPCGHRICEQCVEDMFTNIKEGTAVPCPGEEEDCLELSKDQLIPDRATSKELQRLLVYCKNIDTGCTEEIRYIDMESHEQICIYRTLPCPNEGCQEKCLEKDLQKHISECDFTPTLCDVCDLMIARRHIQNGHKTACIATKRPCPLHKLGCNFEGFHAELQEHSKLCNVQHCKQIAQQISKANAAQDDMKRQLNSMQSTITNIQKDIDQGLITTVTNADSMQQLLTKLESEFAFFRSKLDDYVTMESFDRQSVHIQDIADSSKRTDQRLVQLENGKSDTCIPGDIVEKMSRLESTVGMHDHRIAESELRFRLLETASFDGKLIWRIPDYTRRKRDAVEGRTLSLYSQPFYSSHYGYKMCARAYLNGDGLGKGTHFSLFFVVMKGEHDALLAWPFRQKVTLSILDQSGRRKHITDAFRPDPTSTSFQKPVGELNVASGSPMFAEHNTIESEPYLKDNTLYVCVTIATTDLSYPWP